VSNDDLVAVISFSITLTCVVILVGFRWSDITKALKDEPVEYKEYETAPAIAMAWHDSEKIGQTCGDCGCSDAPIAIHTYPYDAPKCKWCCEFDNITYHLKTNGTRRFKKEKV